MEKSELGKFILIHAIFIVGCGAVACFKFITEPWLLHTHGAITLFSLFAATLAIIYGLKTYRDMSDQ